MNDEELKLQKRIEELEQQTENMTEEEYFRKTYPDSCYGEKPLSPYWDFFQYGVEFGERQSAKKIEELEQRLEQTEKDLADYQFNYPTIKELTKENAELRRRLDNLFNSDCWASEKIAKAKEIIKGLLSCCRNYPQENVEKMKQAEQFIKEIEK